MILAKSPARGNIARDGRRRVEKRIAESQLTEYRRELQVLDTVIVPVIEISLDRKYDELIGARLLNPKWELWFITQARQDIRFRLDEFGARLESTAEIAAAGSDGADQPRQMIFDRPFLLLLREKNDGKTKEPYLAVWIENTEVLKAFSRSGARSSVGRRRLRDQSFNGKPKVDCAVFGCGMTTGTFSAASELRR